MMLLTYLFACADPETVLRAVEPPATAEEVAARRAAAELRVTPANLDATYVKPTGVYVDARHFGGRSYRSARADVEEQLGAVIEEREVPAGGRELVFERGTLRLSGDTIQMIEVPLPEPVRRTEALGLLGFPPATDEYQSLSLEFRLLNAWGFRRIRLFRVARGAEEVTRVQVWRFSEGEG
ncbi:MAG: hypothetical protein Q8P18_28510 [Pseudomonadota bacterium]|nr:hypothetical protein [Pseudomonadota bacterium]